MYYRTTPEKIKTINSIPPTFEHTLHIYPTLKIFTSRKKAKEFTEDKKDLINQEKIKVNSFQKRFGCSKETSIFYLEIFNYDLKKATLEFEKDLDWEKESKTRSNQIN